MLNIRRFSNTTQYTNYRDSGDYVHPGLIKIGEAGIINDSTEVVYAEEPETMTLIRHWDGTSNLSSSKWYDKVGNQYWTMTGSPTHGTGYYEFSNTNPASASKYGTLNGALPDLGYYWKIIVDLEVGMQSNNPGIFSVIDFGSIGSVSTGKCAFCVGLYASSGKWYINSKFNGNDGASTYSFNAADLDSENVVTTTSWLRRTVTVGVRDAGSGKSETYIKVPGIGEAVSSPWTKLRFNRWESGKSFIARSQITPASGHKYATSCRVHDIKIYYKPV